MLYIALVSYVILFYCCDIGLVLDGHNELCLYDYV